MNLLKKIQGNKLFCRIMSAVLCVIPLCMLLLLNELVAYAADGFIPGRSFALFIPFVAVEIAGIVMLGLATSFSKVVRGAGWVLTFLFPFILYFCVEWLCFGSLTLTLQFFFNTHYFMMLFMVALLTAIFWILNMIWGRIWISSAVMSVVFLVLGYINLAKLGINGDPLLPTDLAFASKLGDLTGFAQGALPFPKELVFTALILAAVTLVFFFGKNRGIKRLWVRPIIAFFCAAFVLLTVMIPSVKDYLFLGNSIEMSRQYRQTVVYANHGFLGGFVINIEGYVSSPEGYSKQMITDTINSYGETANKGETFQSPDVIVYLGESVFDFTQIDSIEFSEDPLKVLHQLQDKHLSGNMLQASGVGGGTVRSEFEVLTGINLVDMKEGLI
ncbi:MAG: hypothetical protein IJN42_04490, partial [Clostridia bacterium]|nr:hypothetical protein [Clostridia bacterium]